MLRPEQVSAAIKRGVNQKLAYLRSAAATAAAATAQLRAAMVPIHALQRPWSGGPERITPGELEVRSLMGL